MESLPAHLIIIGLVLSLIEALAIGFWYKSDQYGLLTFGGGAIGSIIPVGVYILKPSIFYELGIWSLGGKDFFGSTLFMAIIILFGMVILGNIMGVLIGLIVSLIFFSN